MITADQLLAHAAGDYLLQSDWMANHKTSRPGVALVHALTYSIPFTLLNPSLGAWAAIVLSHALIDHYRLARYAVWAKEWLGPGLYWLILRFSLGHPASGPHPGWPARWPEATRPLPLAECPTGYAPDKPSWMSVWLLIIADNTLHVALNGAALKWL